MRIRIYNNNKVKILLFIECNKRGDIMSISSAYKITGLVVLVVGSLFFLRDLGVNFIGDISGWTIIIVLVGAALLAGDFQLNKNNKKKK